MQSWWSTENGWQMKKNRGPVHSSSERGYRSGCPPREGEVAFQVVLEESDLWVVASSRSGPPRLEDAALDLLQNLRGQLKTYIALHPEFATSFTPVSVGRDAPLIVRRMAAAAECCGVGPMAAVAGGVAQCIAEGLSCHAREVLVENGGDTYLLSSKERIVGFLPDPGSQSVIGLRLPANAFPVSLCSSSATIGHSASLGKGELVAVRSKSGFFADAAATALCNMLQRPKDLDRLLEQAAVWASTTGLQHEDDLLQGVFAQCKGQIAVWGEMELAAL